jgi:hypothetical protein
VRFGGPLAVDFLQTVISSYCRLVITTTSEKYGSSVTGAQAFSSATMRVLSLKARCHHQPMVQSQQPEMLFKKRQRGAQI